MPTAPQPVSHLRIEHAATPSETDMVALDKIHIDHSLQVRVDGLDAATVAEYTEVYRLNGARGMPPLVCFKVFDEAACKDVLLLASGFHRLAAASNAELPKIPVLIRKGDRRAAHLFALLANKGHGLALTNVDKRHLVKMLLADEEWRQWSDRELAIRAGVSATFIGTMRKTVHGAQTEKRKSKDGGLRSVKGAQESGKKRAADNKARNAKADPANAKPEPEELNQDSVTPTKSATKITVPTQPRLPETERIAPKDDPALPLAERRALHVRDQIVDKINRGGAIWRGTNHQLMALVLIIGSEDGPERWSDQLIEGAPNLLADNIAKDIAWNIEHGSKKLAQLPTLPEICKLFTMDHRSFVINAENTITE